MTCLDGLSPPILSSTLVEASSWVGEELFWPAFLLHVGMARLAPDAFSADLADLDVYLDKFDRPDAWPVFAVPLGSGTLHLVVRNLPDDCGIDWIVDNDARATLQKLAEDNGGHDRGPGLPWPLLPQEPAHLLIALPAIGDDQPHAGIRGRLAKALRAVGATASVKELAEELLRHRACLLLQ